MKINNLISKLTELKEELELVGLRDVIVEQVHFQEEYDEEIYVSSAIKEEGRIIIKIEGHKTKVPQNLNRIKLLKEVQRGCISFSGFEPIGLGVVHYIKIGDMELLGREAEKYIQKYDTNINNLCPECSFFCEERFTDGQCK